MPNPVRTQTIVPNVQLAQATTTLMMQEYFYQAHTLAIAAGWAPVRSHGNATNTTASGLANNITQASHVDIGAAGTGAWVFYQRTIGGVVFCLLLFVDDGAGAIQQIGFRVASGAYTGGNNTTLPTISGGVETTTRNINALPFTADGSIGRYSTWRNSNGSFRIVVKEEGTALVNSWLEFYANTDGDGGGQGSFRGFMFGIATSLGSSCITFSNVLSSANYRALTSSGGAVQTTVGESTVGRVASAWTAGHDAFGNLAFSPIVLAATGAAVGRNMGPQLDSYVVPGNAAFGDVDSNEGAQAQNRKAFGELAWYFPTGVAIS